VHLHSEVLETCNHATLELERRAQRSRVYEEANLKNRILIVGPWQTLLIHGSSMSEIDAESRTAGEKVR
jgi:hypothetical protein